MLTLYFLSAIVESVVFRALRVDHVALVRGLIGGFLATSAMSVFIIMMQRRVPPPVDFWASLVDENIHPRAVGFALHTLYGSLAGALFVQLLEFMAVSSSRMFLLALGYGLVLAVFGSLIWGRIRIGASVELNPLVKFTVLHLMYGVVLGGWLLVSPSQTIVCTA